MALKAWLFGAWPGGAWLFGACVLMYCLYWQPRREELETPAKNGLWRETVAESGWGCWMLSGIGVDKGKCLDLVWKCGQAVIRYPFVLVLIAQPWLIPLYIMSLTMFGTSSLVYIVACVVILQRLGLVNYLVQQMVENQLNRQLLKRFHGLRATVAGEFGVFVHENVSLGLYCEDSLLVSAKIRYVDVAMLGRMLILLTKMYAYALIVRFSCFSIAKKATNCCSVIGISIANIGNFVCPISILKYTQFWKSKKHDEKTNQIIINDLKINIDTNFLQYTFTPKNNTSNKSFIPKQNIFRLFFQETFVNNYESFASMFNFKITVRKIAIIMPETCQHFNNDFFTSLPMESDPELHNIIDQLVNNDWGRVERDCERNCKKNCKRNFEKKVDQDGLKIENDFAKMLKNFNAKTDFPKLYNYIQDLYGSVSNGKSNDYSNEFSNGCSNGYSNEYLINALNSPANFPSFSSLPSFSNFPSFPSSSSSLKSPSNSPPSPSNLTCPPNNPPNPLKSPPKSPPNSTSPPKIPPNSPRNNPPITIKIANTFQLSDFTIQLSGFTIQPTLSAVSNNAQKCKITFNHATLVSRVSTDPSQPGSAHSVAIVKELLFDDTHVDVSYKTCINPNSNAPVSNTLSIPVQNVKLHIRMGHILVPVHLLPYKMPGKGLNSSESVFMPVLDKLAKAVTLVDIKLINLKVYNVFFHTAYSLHDSLSTNPKPPNSIQLVANNILLTIRTISHDTAYFLHLQWPPITSYNLTSASPPATTHEILTSINGFTISLLNTQILYLPSLATTCRLNLHTASVIAALCYTKLQDDASPGNSSPHAILANCNVSNVSIELHSCHIHALNFLLRPFFQRNLHSHAHAHAHYAEKLPLLAALFPQFDLRFLISQLLVKICLPESVLVLQIEKILHELQSLLIQMSNSLQNIMFDSSSNDLVLYPDSVPQIWLSTSQNTTVPKKQNKTFHSNLQLNNCNIKSYPLNNNCKSHPFPVSYFKHCEYQTDICVNMHTCADEDARVMLTLSGCLSATTVNLTKKEVIFAICELVKVVSGIVSGQKCRPKPPKSGLPLLVINKFSGKIEGAIVSFASRNVLPSACTSANDANANANANAATADLASGSRGVQVSVGEVLFDKNADLVNLNILQLKLFTIYEKNLAELRGKPQIHKTIEISSMQLCCGSDREWRAAVPHMHAQCDVSTIWMACVMQYMITIIPRRIGFQSDGRTSNPFNKFSLKCEYLSFELVLPNKIPLVFAANHLTSHTNFAAETKYEISSTNLKVYTAGKDGTSLFCMINVEGFMHKLHCIAEKPLKGDLQQQQQQQNKLAFSMHEFRLSLPFNFLFYKISDSIVTLFKTVKQLRHNFNNLQQGKPLSLLLIVGEKPKIVPHIHVAAEKLNLEIKDDPFEAELGLIYKAGLVEQEERFEKLLLFDQKAKEGFDGDTLDWEKVLEQCELNVSQCGSLCAGQSSVGQFACDLAEKKVRLFENFSKSWIRRYHKVKSNRERACKTKYNDVLGEGCIVDLHYAVNDIKDTPTLFSIFSSHFSLNAEKFRHANLEDFLYEYGKGMPKDTEYSLVVPLYLHIDCSVLTVLLRDYYLPIMHFPPGNSGKSNQPALTIKGNIVLAEKLNVKQVSRRTIHVPFVPSAVHASASASAAPACTFYGCTISRSLDPVKVYTDMHILSNSSLATILSWGKSLQPAISTVMLCLDSVSKPPLDPSPKIGWWDKIRLVVHGRFHFEWVNRVNLYIKGSPDPYKLTDDGAGFVFSWGGGASLDINPCDDHMRFMVTRSKLFIFAVPQFSADMTNYWTHSASSSSYLEGNKFQKVVANLIGDVRWHAGLYFEKELEGKMVRPGETPRTGELKPHYLVERANPDMLDDAGRRQHDSYAGFRSEYVHLSIGFSNMNVQDAAAYNAFHLSPHVILFFQKWWGLFNGSLGLPLRHGALYKLERQDSRPDIKFGASLCSVKYQIQLTPVYLSDFFRHSNASKLQKFTGLKMKTCRFLLDLHQRKQKMHYTNDMLQICREVWHMKFNQGKIDFDACDARLVNTIFDETSVEDLLVKSLGLESDASSSSSLTSTQPDSCNTVYPDLARPCRSELLHLHQQGLHCWIDVNDYIELDVQQPASTRPKVEIVPLFTTPRFTYLRQNDKNTIQQPYPFGSEPSHACLYDAIKPQEETLLAIVQARAREIEQKLKAAKESGGAEQYTQEQLHTLRHNLRVIKNVIHELKEFFTYASVEEPWYSPLLQLQLQLSAAGGNLSTPQLTRTRSDYSSHVSFSEFRGSVSGHSKFSNRYIINNLLLKWNNIVRDHFVAFVNELDTVKSLKYFMGRKIIKYLEDLVASESSGDGSGAPRDGSGGSDDGSSGAPELCSRDYLEGFDGELGAVDDAVAEAEYAYLFKLICPQIQLQSEEKKESVCLVLAQDVELKVIHVNARFVDGVSEDDRIARLMETRYGLFLKEMQTFAVSEADVSGDSGVRFREASFGSAGGSGNWPPWVNFEGFYDAGPLRSMLLTEKTSATVRLDRVNSLFFSSHGGRRMRWKNKDVLRVDVPEVVVRCDALQFDVIYTLVTDLLVFSDLKSTRKSQRLKELVLASDLESVEGIDRYIEGIQRQLRALKKTKHALQMAACRKGVADLVNMWISRYQLKLLYSVRAVQGAPRTQRAQRSPVASELEWQIYSDRIVWHMLDDGHAATVDLELSKSRFHRVNGADGSSTNSVSIGTVRGTNLGDTAEYRDLLGPYGLVCRNMVAVAWKDLPPVGGIPVMEYLSFAFQPMKLQIDKESAHWLFNYVFPTTVQRDKGFGKSRHHSSLQLANRNSNSGQNHNRNSNSDQYAVMAQRSSKYITFNKTKVAPVVICFSYKGAGVSSLADVQDLVVKMPRLVYYNHICSFKELALHLKKDVIKILIRHTGEIITNKLKFIKSSSVLDHEKLSNDNAYENLTNDNGYENLTNDNTRRNIGPAPVIIENGIWPKSSTG